MRLGAFCLTLLGLSYITTTAQAADSNSPQASFADTDLSANAQATTNANGTTQPVDVIEAFHKNEVSLEACLQVDRLELYINSIEPTAENLQTLRDLGKYVQSCQALVDAKRQEISK